MIRFLQTSALLKLESITLVGHSLGAHVMRIAGYMSGGQAQNVIGLDPALPFFFNSRPDQKISSLAGKHVQILHSDADNKNCRGPQTVCLGNGTRENTDKFYVAVA
ncbi:lipase member H-like [Venturia canescens]|uniref:lipase member H-like n=1 Tax=Venturia canescens TaxID=32260 RepID=UPI001C9CA18B|nr:lipase member H-like [Venturia canescens]